jgi:hypothetical protein
VELQVGGVDDVASDLCAAGLGASARADRQLLQAAEQRDSRFRDAIVAWLPVPSGECEVGEEGKVGDA